MTRSRHSGHCVAAIGRCWLVILCGILTTTCSHDNATTPATGGESDYGCTHGNSSAFAAYRVFWGDLHSHTVFSADAASQDPPPGTPADAFAYARDPAGGALDFAAVTDHAETVDSTEWAQSIEACRQADVVGFVPFIGFEYTNCSYQAGHGHKCVVFKSPDEVTPRVIGADACATPKELWNQLDVACRGETYITIPHHPAKGTDYGANMSTDWDALYVDAARQPLAEIYSVHGNSEADGCEEPVKHFQADKSVAEALGAWLATGDAAYKLGVIGSTDNHRASPGAVAEVEENVAEREGPYTGGLAAVWATGCTREEIWDALMSRRTYGTSGGRVGFEFSAKARGEIVAMGGTLAIDSPADVYLHVRATGEHGVGILRIEILKNGELLVAQQTDHLDYRDSGVSGRAYYRVKVFQDPTNMVHGDHCPNERAWSSPIWVEPLARR